MSEGEAEAVSIATIGVMLKDYVVQNVDFELLAMIAGGLVVSYFVITTIASIWAKAEYKSILQTPATKCDIDTFVGEANPVSAFKVAAAHRFRLGYRKASTTPIPLECIPSTHVQGLHVSRNASVPHKNDPEGLQAVPVLELLTKKKTTKPMVVATIRMGFGHHRLAYSACSWALQNGYTTIFHDLLNIESEEADLIKSVDQLYSKASRIASEFGGYIEHLWGQAMLQGDANALRIAACTAAHLQPLLLGYPLDTPIITTHQLVALVASACGFTNVVNLVVDNHPQWFLTVPNTQNLVQGPVNYQSFLQMGVSAKELQHAGHWVGTDLVQHIPNDCKARIAKAQKGFGKDDKAAIVPRTLLIPVGGAGAQRKFIIGLIERLASRVKQDKVHLLLNAGDHPHMKTAFEKVLAKCELPYDTVSTTQAVYDFQKKYLLGGADNIATPKVTLFSFEEYFPAVATTDILCRVADVLVCKPSELAFYPIPKLHIRRVGNHEADSAKRASELGDGTIEAREWSDAIQFVDLFCNSPDLLVQMNQSIIQNNTQGVYSGCQYAVELAGGIKK